MLSRTAGPCVVPGSGSLSRRVGVGAVLALALATGCSGGGPASKGGNAEAGPSGATATFPSATTRPNCAESPRVSPDQAIRGSTDLGQLWALGGQPRVGEEFKIVVRATGSGTLSAVALSPDGSRHAPEAMQSHADSNFARPGDEWGLFFTFDRPGCWQILLDRVDLEGAIILTVEPA